MALLSHCAANLMHALPLAKVTFFIHLVGQLLTG